MILTKAPETGQQRAELQLLLSIRFACLTANKADFMDNPRVKKRISQLNHHLKYQQPSHLFFDQYCKQAGPLTENISLKVCPDTLEARLFNNSSINSLKLANL